MEARLQQMTHWVERARRAGARGSEFFCEETDGLEMTALRGRIQTKEPVSSSTLSVRVWLDKGRAGHAEGAPESGEALLDAALRAAQSAPVSSRAGPIGRLEGKLAGLSLDDRRYAHITEEDRIEVLLQAERSVRQSDKRAVASAFQYQDARRLRCFANSKGVVMSEWDTRYIAEGGAIAEQDTARVEVQSGVQTRTFASIASLPFGHIAGRRAADLLKAGERLDGPTRVSLSSRATAALLRRIGTCFDYDCIQSDEFFLQPGHPPLSSKIHLLDDGRLPGGFRSHSFDQRGVAPVPLTLIREGRLDGRFLALDKSRELDIDPTGHEGPAGIQPSNLLLRSGSRSMNAILTDLGGRVFEVDDFDDLSQLNLHTGDLTTHVHGHVLKSGRRVGAMQHARLTGNLLDVLAQVVDLASNTDRFGHIDAPAILVDGFTLDPA